MFESITQFFRRFKKSEKEESKSTAKERLHLVLAQDRANISADFLEMMKQEIIEVIKKYIDIDEKAIDVRLTNKEGEDGKIGAPALYANIPIITIKNEARKLEGTLKKENKTTKQDENNTEENTEKEEVKDSESKNTAKQDNNAKKELKVENNLKAKKYKKKGANSTSTIKKKNTSKANTSNNKRANNEKNLEEVDNEKKDS